MSTYLQRLFDRGAALGSATAAAPAADVSPAGAPGSPALAFDQRLADPALARLFGILGGAPELPAPGEGEAGVGVAAAPAVLERTVVPEPPAAPPSPEHGLTVRAPLAKDVQHRDSAPSPMQVARDEVAPALPAPPAEPAAMPAARVQSPAAPTETVPAAVEPAPVVRQIAMPTQRAQVAPATRVAEATPARARPGNETEPALAPVRPHVDSLQARGPVGPLPPPRVSGDPRPPGQPQVRPASPEVEPPRRAPAAIESPARTGIDADQVERIARAAVQAELARRDPAPPRAATPRAGTTLAAEREAGAKAPRPMTAREASVIGELEPSSLPLTIFGWRRR